MYILFVLLFLFKVSVGFVVINFCNYGIVQGTDVVGLCLFKSGFGGDEFQIGAHALVKFLNLVCSSDEVRQVVTLRYRCRRRFCN